MCAAIVNGLTLAEAIRRGLVRDDRERALWAKLREQITAIEAKGGTVDIPTETL